MYSFISAKCITYGRISTLEEALYSFLIQDYPADKAELVIVNDYPLQKLHYDHPQVKIINLPYTFDTIGDKENYAVNACSGDIIAVWDDDDIAMPNHLKNIAKYFVEGSNILHWNKGILINSGEISAIGVLGNSGIVYSKDAWRKIGGHPLENAGYDVTLVNKLYQLGGIVRAQPPDNEVSWAYYWANRSYHMSGLGTDNDTRPNVVQRHKQHIENERLAGRIPTGDIQLKPHWTKDYHQMLKDFVAKK